MNPRVIATFHTEKPTELVDGEQLVIEREGNQAVARRLPNIDSDEPIHSFAELAACLEAEAKRRR